MFLEIVTDDRIIRRLFTFGYFLAYKHRILLSSSPQYCGLYSAGKALLNKAVIATDNRIIRRLFSWEVLSRLQT